MVTISQGWVRANSEASNSVGVSHVCGRDLSIRAIFCCLPGTLVVRAEVEVGFDTVTLIWDMVIQVAAQPTVS